MKKIKFFPLFLWIGIFLGIVSSFLYFLFKLRQNKKDLSTAFVNKYINISQDQISEQLRDKEIPQKTTDGTKKDNLTLIKGIGPAIERLLNENKITTFKDLSSVSVENLKQILETRKFRLADPSNWPEQAKKFQNQ